MNLSSHLADVIVKSATPAVARIKTTNQSIAPTSDSLRFRSVNLRNVR